MDNSVYELTLDTAICGCEPHIRQKQIGAELDSFTLIDIAFPAIDTILLQPDIDGECFFRVLLCIRNNLIA